MPTLKPAYQYRGDVRAVIDGDTVDVDIDLGLETIRRVRCRLNGIQAPETKGPTAARGQAAAEALDHLLRVATLGGPGSRQVIVQTTKDRTEKFGRFLVTLFGAIQGEPVDINARLVDQGHAVAWNGQGKRPD